MKPSSRLLILLVVGVVFSTVISVARFFMPEQAAQSLFYLWLSFYLFLFIAALTDLIISKNALNKIACSRIIPGSLALGVDNSVTLTITNNSDRAIDVLVTDQYPDQVNVTNIPRPLIIAANNFAEIIYAVTPFQRGDAKFGFIQLSVLSRLKLWRHQLTLGDEETVKIYPNFRTISQFKTLGLHHHMGQMGIHLKQRRGQGMTFHQLREFREGDSPYQIDWKATARMRKPISREYQDERDQDIIFLLDCGRRMHSSDGELSHFDHVLNAFLLTSHVALKQGDAVGLITFAGSERWISPIKGQHNINTLLNHVYDLHSGTDTSDFSQAAQQLMNKHRKRSLVVLITNLHDEDSDDLKPAIEIIARRHLIIVANLRERFLDYSIEQPVHNLKTALNYAGTSEYSYKRHRLLKSLKQQGVFIADSLPHLLHIDLINEYLSLKRRGII